MLTRPARESDMERIIVLHAAPYAFGILHATNLDHIKLDRLEAGNRFGRLSFTVDDSERHNRMARIFRIRIITRKACPRDKLFRAGIKRHIEHSLQYLILRTKQSRLDKISTVFSHFIGVICPRFYLIISYTFISVFIMILQGIISQMLIILR